MQHITYGRLTLREREEISRGLVAKETIRAIAQSLHRHPSTISREVARGGGKTGYRAHRAHSDAQYNAGTRAWRTHRLSHNNALRTYVIAKLRLKWSPRMISESLKKAYAGDDTMQISHEAIYQYIYVLPRGALRRTLTKGLRQERVYRRKRGKRRKPRKEHIADMISIEERPREVADRSVPGHWEGDLMLGRYSGSALGTLVERTTRYTILVPLGAGKDAVSVRKAYVRAFRTLPKEIKKTLTYDQGKEMSDHKRFTIDANIQVYFAHPASPWERGTNENTNGLIRQYFPKGTDFTKVSTREIKRVQRELNDRPRAVLDYEKPDEVINKLVALKV